MARKKKSKSTKIVKRKSRQVRVIKKKKVQAVPKGYHSLTPYLIVNDAHAAIEFYKKAFGAKNVMRMDLPNGKISHAEITIGDSKVMLADEFPQWDARAPAAYGGSPVSLHVYVKNVDAIVAKAHQAGAKIIRPVQDQFYGDRSGGIEDPFGHKWYIATHIEDVSMKEIKKRAKQFYQEKCGG